jgi:hypothetical protein
MTEEQIKHMANRFLQWKLPEPFRPDNGVSFTPSIQWHADGRASPHWPVGTNLFCATEAEEMVRFMVEGMQS